MSLLDRILNIMRLKDDEPDMLIKSMTNRIEMCKANDRVFDLQICTNLEQYDESERLDYCFQLELEESEKNFLLNNAESVTSNREDLAALRNHFACDTPSILGLIGIVVFFNRIVLNYVAIDNPTHHCSFSIKNPSWFRITVKKPCACTSLYDCGVGTYEQIEITQREAIASTYETLIIYQLDSHIVRKDMVSPCKFVSDPSKEVNLSDPEFLLIDTHYSTTVESLF